MATMTKKNTMTKKKLIQSISQKRNCTQTTLEHVIQAFLDKMTNSLSKGQRLEFRDFGVFEVVERKQKIGRNPKNPKFPSLSPHVLP